ncbi:MAG: acyl-CoA ligase (AMP-forming), exosortase A system-associated, partial [Cellulomonas sp.]|nr:acyl-CoA ligase (AMP-forming), exosortase A system-associated [Cellulomonas sp.]
LGQRILLVASPTSGDGLDVEALLGAMKHQVPVYMLPATVVTRDEIPRSPNGKFDRASLRAELAT